MKSELLLNQKFKKLARPKVNTDLSKIYDQGYTEQQRNVEELFQAWKTLPNLSNGARNRIDEIKNKYFRYNQQHNDLNGHEKIIFENIEKIYLGQKDKPEYASVQIIGMGKPECADGFAGKTGSLVTQLEGGFKGILYSKKAIFIENEAIKIADKRLICRL